MKIGIDARLWNETGVGRYVRNLVKNLLKIDKKNSYVLFVLEKDLKRINNPESGIMQKNVTLVTVNIRWHTLSEQIYFPQLLNKYRLDLMHFPYFSVPIYYKKPYVVTIHDLILHHFSTGEASTLPNFLWRAKLLGYHYVLNQAAKNAKMIIAVSNATKKEITQHLKVPGKKVRIVYEGFDTHIQSSVPFKLPFSTPFFLHVGNIFPHKNIYELIDAFALVRGKIDCELVFVGKEDYFYKALKEVAKSIPYAENIHFFGEVTDKELASLYKKAEALVIPSLMEGFGLPALEAMANNCLVLSSQIPSLEEVCSKAAVYFDPHSKEDLAKVLENVLRDRKKYLKHMELGKERVKAFSWIKTAQQTLHVYEQSISDSKNE